MTLATTLARYDRACREAHAEAADLRAQEKELAEAIKALVQQHATIADASERDLSIALGMADDLASDLYYDAIRSAEEASQDGSYGEREWERD